MLLSSLLFQVVVAATAIAIPTSSERHAQRLARRAAGTHLSQPNQVISRPAVVPDGSNTTQVEYSSNWSGAVLNAPANTFKSVTGTFVVPVPKAPSGGSGGFYSTSAWVGIDGDTCDTAILQTGIDFTINNGEVSYDAWYEWYPEYAFDFSGFQVSEGHTITTNVIATSLTTGIATIINHSTGQQVAHLFNLPEFPLCGQDAEWIVEDYEENGQLVPLANFGTVTFTDASAGTSSGAVGPANAEIILLEQNGVVLTAVSTTASSVTVRYIGP
ncbi:acid proteinase [Cubamyces menziesii]|nr:acid proteinase [Cubamyces menziesii]